MIEFLIYYFFFIVYIIEHIQYRCHTQSSSNLWTKLFFRETSVKRIVNMLKILSIYYVFVLTINSIYSIVYLFSGLS